MSQAAVTNLLALNTSDLRDSEDAASFGNIVQAFATERPQSLHSLSNEEMFKTVGKYCAQMSKACSGLRDIILQLRKNRVTLVRPEDYNSAMSLIASGYEHPPSRDYLKKCTGALKSYLRMPEIMIPNHPSLTGKQPQWMWRGDQVDAYDKKTKTWWHAVIVDDMPKNAKLCKVYWVGWAPSEIGSKVNSRQPSDIDLNPTFVSRGDVMCHVSGKSQAGNERQYSVSWIKSNYCVVDVDVDVLGDNADSAVTSAPEVAQNGSEAAQVSVPEASSEIDPIVADRRSARLGAAAKKVSGTDDDAEADQPNLDDSGLSSKPKPTPLAALAPERPKPKAGRKPKSKQATTGTAKPASNAVLIDCLSACDASRTHAAIATLEYLDAGSTLIPKEYTFWQSELRSRCEFLARLYQDDDYTTLCVETLNLLDAYKGRETQGDFAAYHDHLGRYGWVISPRMWTAHEIVVLCVILVDPGLQFSAILQKDKGKIGEKRQNRAMACLDNRVQQIMYSRLKSYGFVNNGHLPPDVPAGVVLNSGGSYLQLATWEYLHCARLVTDFSVNPSIIRVTGAPEYTGGNAVYVATTTRRLSGEPVYVSLSPLEMNGPPPGKEDPASWDGTPLQESLPNKHVLCELVDSTEAKKWATERVLYWENSKIVIQSITAYGTGMHTLTLDCVRIGQSVTSARAIIGFDWDKKESVMQDLPAERLPTIICVRHSTSKTLNHTLSFGFKKYIKNVGIAKTKNEGVPQETRKQQFHKDGPTRYDARQFDKDGKIKTDAPIATDRKEALPTHFAEGRATSALFAFFTRTFLGLKPAARSDRVDPINGLRLHAPLGTAVIFYFDEDHQGWKCRSKDQVYARAELAELAIHVRAHFYVYSKDLRFLPTSDLEETFEFLACYAQGRCLDEGTKLVMLDSLNTFVNEPDPVETTYSTFQDQKELDSHVSRVAALNQNELDARVAAANSLRKVKRVRLV